MLSRSSFSMKTRSSGAALGILLIMGLLPGCATISPQPGVPVDARPEPGAAYVAGQFHRSDGPGFALILKNLDTNTEYAMPLGTDSFSISSFKDRVLAIKVPPGRYAVTHWSTYGTVVHLTNNKTPVTSPLLARSFQVPAGGVAFLGRFALTQTRTSDSTYQYTNWRIQPERITTAGAREALVASYTGFDQVAFTCLACLD
jgi:hypothetical protein